MKKNKIFVSLMVLTFVMGQIPSVAFADYLNPDLGEVTNSTQFNSTNPALGKASGMEMTADKVCRYLKGQEAFGRTWNSMNPIPSNAPSDAPVTNANQVESFTVGQGRVNTNSCALRAGGRWPTISQHLATQDMKDMQTHQSYTPSGGGQCKFLPPDNTCSVGRRVCTNSPGDTENTWNWNNLTENQSCDEADLESLGCQLLAVGDTTQVKTWCDARDQMIKGKKAENVLIALDTVAAATCTTNCIMYLSHVGAAAAAATSSICTAASLSASIAEITAAAQFKKNKGLGKANHDADYKLEKCPAGTEDQESCKTITKRNENKALNAVTASLGGIGIANAGLQGLQAVGSSVAAAGNTGATVGHNAASKAISCGVAAFTIAQMAIRAAAVAKANDIKKKAEVAIMSLVDPTKRDTNGDGTPDSSENGGSGSGGYGGGSGYAGGTGAPGSNTSGGSGGGLSGYGGINGVNGDGLLSFGAVDGTGIENSLFNKSQFGQKVKQAASALKLTDAKIHKMLAQGGAAGLAAGIGSQLGLNSKALNEMKALAKNAEIAANKFAAENGTAFAATGGALRTPAAAAAENPFSLGANTNMGDSKDLAFQREIANEPDDIFHSKSSDNIFQIVSRKISATSNRVK